MKRTIRLTEGRLRRMIREAVEAEMNNGGINNAELEQRLANGEDPMDVFYWIGDCDNGYAEVMLNDKYNWINKEGQLVSDTWFELVYGFNDGYAVVVLNGKWNHINTEGRILSNDWFDYARDFHEGYAVVKLKGKYNFINKEGRFISDTWFDWVGYFSKGFADVRLDGKWFKIDTEGNLYDFKTGEPIR